LKLFNIQVFTSDRAYDVTLRNLSIIRASQLVHRLSVASTALLWSIKRFLVPGKVVIAPLIKLRAIKAMKQSAAVAPDADVRLGSLKRVTATEAMQLSFDGNVRSVKRVKENPVWRIVTTALLGAKKPIANSAALGVDLDLNIQKVRKRRLGEVSRVLPADMNPLTLDELDYIVEDDGW
jgi:hypothetical protein